MTWLSIGKVPMRLIGLAAVLTLSLIVAPLSVEAPPQAEILRVISSSPTDHGPVFQSVAVVVDCGFPLVAALTPRSVRELALVPGVSVTAVFKASAAHLIPYR